MAILGFKLNPNLYLRDPQSTSLGQQIIAQSVKMIDRIGFEKFTFKKLGAEIGSTEASVYRYFENKHRLLLYLIDWYWTWLDFRIEFMNQNVKSPIERLRNCLNLLVQEDRPDPGIPFIDGKKLHGIVVSEFEKTYLTKQVDKDNKEGLFLPYKGLCKRIAAIIKEMNPRYAFPHSLVSTILLSATHQVYYAHHLPSLTDIKKDSKRLHNSVADFLEQLVVNTISHKRK